METKIEDNYSFNENKKIIIKTSNATTNSNENNDGSITNNGDKENVDNNTIIDIATNEKDTFNWELFAIIMTTTTVISIIVIIILLVVLAKKGKT